MADLHPTLASDLTVEAPRQSFDSENESDTQLRKSARRRVALVEGSTPHMSSETRGVLRRRLRIAAVLLFIGFASFFLYSTVRWKMSDHLQADYRWVFFSQIAVITLLGLSAWKLCAKCDLSMTKLRIGEAIVFGAPALFFTVLTYHKLTYCAMLDEGHAHIASTPAAWMLLIFCYAIFIPNNWRRAAAVIGPLALTPMIVMAVAYFTCPALSALLQSDDFDDLPVEQAMLLALSAMVAIVGVHTINALRHEAFVAKQLGQYRLKRLLGSGGMGEVYLAEHQMMKRPCAVKVIRPEKAGDPQVLARFEREVRATAKLSHWNSIDIYDYGRTPDGTFYYVMEFLPGHNLGELVREHGPLPASRILYLMRQVCDALAEAHSHGLVHRDIKPANIYCAYRGGVFDVAKLLDFGLAKPLTDANDSGLTQEGSITGSPLFMSPEQAGSEEVDGRSDIYSLGAVMYFMATGKAPFEYASPLKVMIAHASEDPEPPRYLNGDIPAELEEVILRSLEKRPGDRYQTVAELREALDRVPVDSEWTARMAADWWNNYGCPQRKAMAEEAVEMAAV
ncbi:MAG: serine/threonine protein kinase [Planctomycetaceae bacterium]|nr:serine/threonine protein kinase [Planctomycetaceae bacterium]